MTISEERRCYFRSHVLEKTRNNEIQSTSGGAETSNWSGFCVGKWCNRLLSMISSSKKSCFFFFPSHLKCHLRLVNEWMTGWMSHTHTDTHTQTFKYNLFEIDFQWFYFAWKKSQVQVLTTKENRTVHLFIALLLLLLLLSGFSRVCLCATP